jgi:hypothetical protein
MTDLLVATRKGLFELSGRVPEVTRAHFLGAPVSAVLRDPRDNTWYAALGHGHFGVKIHRSDDEGVTWTELAAPAYPPKPADVEDICPMRQTPRPWNTELVWTLEAGHAAEPGVLWAGTIPGGLFRSPDRGDTWQLVESLWNHPARQQWFGGGYDYPGVHSVLVDPRGPGRVVAGVSCGGVWRSDDGGASWQVGRGMRAPYMPDGLADAPEIQDPHRLAFCAAAPDVMWTQHHCGMFRSLDAGLTWQQLTDVAPSDFGFAVAAHPTEPDTAWFVPAAGDEARVPVDGRVVVTKTTDGGRTFTAATTGLPQSHAYDLSYRHALDVDAAGERVAFGSTTGSMWNSNDTGDTFTAITASLPPIFAVRYIS